MFDHIGITVVDLARARAFYEAALKPLGITTQKVFEGYGVGMGRAGRAQFWIAQGVHTASTPRGHIAFATDDRKVVDAFYAAALAAGGVDNGAPGIRAHYHAHYYGAFVVDADGYNIEVVSHKEPATRRSRRSARKKKAAAGKKRKKARRR